MRKKIYKLSVIITVAILTSAYGYMGELPDLNSYFKDKPQSEQGNPNIPASDKTPIEKEKLQELIPAQDSNLYLEILGDKSKETAYLKDMRDLKEILTDFKNSLNSKCTLQTFTSYSNTYNLYVTYVVDKYKNKKEANSSSYSAIITLNNRILIIRKRWKSYEDNHSYIPSAFLKTKSNKDIASQINILKKEINNTLYEITKK